LEDVLLSQISSALVNLSPPEEIQYLVNKALSQKIPLADIVEKGLRIGLEGVGAKYEAGEYFLAELLFAVSIIDELMTNIRPLLEGGTIESRGRIVLGTVRGDMHDIGKNIFKMMAEGAGFNVDDLNVDVDPELFVQKSRDDEPDILGLSCLLTTALPEVKVVIDLLKQHEVRYRVAVIIGGNAVTKEFGQETGADGTALNAVEGVNLCKGIISK